MRDLPPGWDVDGPIVAEAFVVWRNGERLELIGPCGAADWPLEHASPEHPVEVVDRIVRDVVCPPVLVHSTSWRRDGDAVVLTFIVVVEGEVVGGRASAPVGRADLARGGATAAPARIGHAQVAEHGLRHLAWLAKDDRAVQEELSPAWRDALAAYVPQPFRAVG